MKKLLFTTAIFIVIKLSFSNPIPEPPVITEIYFEGNQIYIEVFFQDFYYEYFDITNFDNLRLVSNNGYMEFIEGIDIEYNEVMVLSNSVLLNPLIFDPAGDNIYMETDDGWELGWEHYRYGNEPYADVLAPQAGQSLAMQGEYDFYYNMFLSAGIGIEETPTLGTDVWVVNTRGSMEGWIYDINNNPIPGLQVYDVFTDEVGYFQKTNLLCNIQNYIYVRHNGNIIHIFSDTIYANQTSQHIIQLDTTLTSIPDYFNYPNPVLNLTYFSITIPDEIKFNEGYLGIYSISGKLVDRITLTNYETEISWNASSQKPGIYLYNIVLDQKFFHTKKMILQ